VFKSRIKLSILLKHYIPLYSISISLFLFLFYQIHITLSPLNPIYYSSSPQIHITLSPLNPIYYSSSPPTPMSNSSNPTPHSINFHLLLLLTLLTFQFLCSQRHKRIGSRCHSRTLTFKSLGVNSEDDRSTPRAKDGDFRLQCGAPTHCSQTRKQAPVSVSVLELLEFRVSAPLIWAG